MSNDLPQALPYGLRKVVVTPYVDRNGSVLGTSSYHFPIAQTLSFAEGEEFDELRGDDSLTAIHGRGAEVDGSIEGGGISITVWSILTGGAVVEAGVAPNRQRRLRKRGGDDRPYFRIDGQMVSDSGGDVHARVYRCKCNGRIQAEFRYGQFQITTTDFKGSPLPSDTDDWLYEIIQSETKKPIGLVPEPNPSGIVRITPPNVTVTGQVLTWPAVQFADHYVASIDGGPNIPVTFPYTVSGVVDGTHSVVVTTVDADGNRRPAAAVTVTVTMSAPTNVTPVMFDANRIDITWDAIAGATSYLVSYRQSGGAWANVPKANGGEPTAASTSVTGLTANTTYEFRVCEVKGGAQGPWSVPATETTGLNYPVATVSANVITWTDVGADHYAMFVDGVKRSLVISPYTLVDLPGAHTIIVTAVSSAGDEFDSLPVTVTLAIIDGGSYADTPALGKLPVDGGLVTAAAGTAIIDGGTP